MRIWLAAAVSAAVIASPALALDLNGYRAQHKMPRLAYSSHLAGIAYEQARLMAGRGQIDHKDFIRRIGFAGGTHAENVLVGCADQDCAIRTWAKSAGHRRNMLRGDVSHYGIASVKSHNGRRYWALELGSE
ncbi:MAG: hypothetical protein OJF62_000584 [Pseudolabrys sp.]|jgi:uncharacterized protein YkwD|nr:hypothetical protein [Pseudolabrys sp.]